MSSRGTRGRFKGSILLAALFLTFLCIGRATPNCSYILPLPPLVDLGPGQTYNGYEGGLYPGASNVRPAAHDAAGQRIAQGIVPLDASGNPDPNGRIVLIPAYVSNGFGCWHTGARGNNPPYTFMNRANADPAKNPKLTVAYGFEYQLGSDNDARDPNGNFYDSTDFALGEQNLTPLQVQIVWLFFPASPSWANVPWHTPSTTPPANLLSFPGDAEVTKQAWKEMIYAIRTRYPNIKIIYNSTKGYMYAQGSEAGPLSSPGGPVEPWNHDIAWSVKWLIEDQINGDPNLNYDPARGPVMAPWLSWGPYFWTYGDGTPRAYDGFTWTCADLGGDHLHPSDSGCSKYSDLLMNFFKNDATTTPWFLAR
jgi:hypothetical protein